jgi:hypothetical protein
MSRARVRRRVAAVGVLCVALASVAACGSGGAGALPAASGGSAVPVPASTNSAPPSGTSAQAAGAARAALAAYRAAFADWVAVESVPSTSDYQSPVLTRHMSGQALSSATESIYLNTSVKGAVSKGVPVLNPAIGQLVPAAAPTQVVVNDCVDTTSWLLWTADGKHLFNDVPGGRQKTQALIALVGGAWKMTQLHMQKIGTC